MIIITIFIIIITVIIIIIASIIIAFADIASLPNGKRVHKLHRYGRDLPIRVHENDNDSMVFASRQDKETPYVDMNFLLNHLSAFLL